MQGKNLKQTESNRIKSNSGDQSDEINVSAIKYTQNW